MQASNSSKECLLPKSPEISHEVRFTSLARSICPSDAVMVSAMAEIG